LYTFTPQLRCCVQCFTDGLFQAHGLNCYPTLNHDDIPCKELLLPLRTTRLFIGKEMRSKTKARSASEWVIVTVMNSLASALCQYSNSKFLRNVTRN
jgi:hypothetical protein